MQQKEINLVAKLFQYKICYSKILNEINDLINVNEFQYKICYSKIKRA
ncbi:hypothetical protein CHAB381_0384 [Campylobacter hominis ATCC BAA-381]|uniref:Uncharacterized protein n=1 Tax=Campylobacter hominis (strain ATCC BAA-381 / DSM 21671 / CCUG 45161 / LMG 19568 / NCTC 13146 / CH001A) TaxID=360107 RepID=A7I0E3_CAMHC|nr:hypothetical protein CHAB381_0384 [Campylobacter hominis ATCC BAA-381]